jgi:hypothetical protein
LDRVSHTKSALGADGESAPITVLAMPIWVFCAPPADYAAQITDPLAERFGCASH